MTPENASIALNTLVGVAALWILVYWFWRGFIVDRSRQRLFELRAELFDLGAEGDVDFGHYAYGNLRSRINVMIRFSHRFTFINLLLLMLSSRYFPIPSVNERRDAWKEAVDSLPSQGARDKIMDLEMRFALILAKHLVVGSPMLVLSLITFGCYMIGRIAFSQVLDRFASLIVPGVELIEVHASEEEQSNYGGIAA